MTAEAPIGYGPCVIAAAGTLIVFLTLTWQTLRRRFTQPRE